MTDFVDTPGDLAAFFAATRNPTPPPQPGSLSHPPTEQERTTHTRRVKQTATMILALIVDTVGMYDETQLRAAALEEGIDPVYLDEAIRYLTDQQILVPTTLLAFPDRQRELYKHARRTTRK